MPDKEIMTAVMGGGWMVLWWLLRQKDAAQQRAIDLLWEKHDTDAKDLETLKLQVAGEHYKRSELDSRFEKLQDTFREEIRSLGAEVKALTAAILENKK